MTINRVEEYEVWQGLNQKQKRGFNALKDNVLFKDGRAFSTATGEEVTGMIDVGIVTSDNQARRLKEKDELSKHQTENGGFIFAFFKQSSAISERFPSLTKQDAARLMYIATFISWQENRLQSDNGHTHYTKKHLEELVSMSRKRFNELFKRLKNENIIHEKETGELFINPSVFYRGELSAHDYDIGDLQYTRLFKQTVRDLYKQFGGRTLGQLANIYTVLPFLNFQTNIICFNPNETSEDLIKPMPISELADILEYKDITKLTTALNRIKVDGKPVFAFVDNPHDRRERRVIVNPRVVFAGNGESLKAVKAMFN